MKTTQRSTERKVTRLSLHRAFIMAFHARPRPYRSRSRRRLQKGLEPQVSAEQEQPAARNRDGHRPQQEDCGPKLLSGQILQNQWRVERLLSKGSFGVVYEGSDVNDSKNRVAIKTEPIVTNLQLLRIELDVLIAMQGKSHHVKILASKFGGEIHGDTNEHLEFSLFLIQWEAFGENVTVVNEIKLGKIPTVLRIGRQMLVCLKDVHEIGYLHRDVKPANFAVDCHPNSRSTRGLVYIFDFGLCRQYKNMESGRLREPRNSVPFRGTVRYASIDVLSGKDMGRHDDLWSMFYVLCEMANSQLPWRRMVDKEKVRSLKQNTCPTLLWRQMPAETKSHFVDHLQTLTFFDKPDYEKIDRSFEQALKDMQINQQTLFDWESPDDRRNDGDYDDQGDNDTPGPAAAHNNSGDENLAAGDDDKSLAVGRSEG
uniref:Protein kinase domain-containing protein n=1 Tax=Romanomermis culicivorax TaxID=13658 RepID=A0A915JV23_ROMCU